MSTMTLSFRPAREDDLERLLDLHTSAFPDPRGRPARARNFQKNPLGALSDLHILLEDEAVLAHAFLFPLEAWFGGVRVPVAGIATVGVAPEARGRGLGSRLLQHLHEVARARGDALAVLYPFRQGFYTRLGYATTSTYRRLRLHPASIPWRPGLRARAATGADREALVACLEAAAMRRTGTLARTKRAWESRLADELRTWLVVEGSGGSGAIEGYVVWTLEQREPHAETALQVRELAGRTVAAERELWALVGAQRDQVAVVHADVAADDPFERSLVDPDRWRHGEGDIEHTLGEVASGPMVRVLHAARALESRGWPTDGTLLVAVGDQTLQVTARGGRATAVPTHAEPHVRLDTRALGAVAFGGLPASHAARLGWLAARDDDALALADAVLGLPPYFSPDPF
jgi:predicted acetyltransferase